MDKYQGKYRVPSARLASWDYGSNASYFVTICIRNNRCLFGKVTEGRMQLSAAGLIAQKCWSNIPLHFPIAMLDVYVIMPNHVHGIISINKPLKAKDSNYFPEKTGNQFGPQSQNLASILRGFKTGVTMEVRTFIPDFKWQERYHDHIIDYDDYIRIHDYILTNPIKWQLDKYFIP